MNLLELSGILLVAIAVTLKLAREATAISTCLASGPMNQSYTVNVCITSPADGAQLTGNQNVKVFVSITGSNPGIQSLTFFLDGGHLITDFQSPYAILLSTDKWIDGQHRLSLEVAMRDSFTAQGPTLTIRFRNGVVSPPVNDNTFTPTRGTVPAQGQPFLLAATGDGAAGEAGAASVTAMIDSWNPNMFLYLGDVYENGSATEFANWYAPDDYFGRFREITNPTVGNHEYNTANASGYFDYWDNVPDFYSVDAAGWHIISLNSNRPDSWEAQFHWLSQDLQAHRNPCTLAFYHHPLFTIGSRDGDFRVEMVPIWQLLDKQGVDVVLTGHDHNYQRWKPLDGAGNPDPNGIVQFVIGTGGHGVQRFIRTDHRVAASDATRGHLGALRMELNPQGATYQYITAAGLEDSGAIACDGVVDAASPTAPTGLTAKVNPEGGVSLAWTAATDRVGVSGYQVYRNGALLTTTGAVTSYTDTTVGPLSSYTYELRATDPGGNLSAPSNQATVTTPALSLQFSEGFESGDMTHWTNVVGPLRVQQDEVASGAWASRATSAGEAAYASKTLANAQADLYFRFKFKLLSPPADSTYVARFRTDANQSILGIYVSKTGKLSLRNDVAGESQSSSQEVSTGQWHDIQVHLRVDAANPAAGEVEVWYDGVILPDLSTSQHFGAAPVKRLQLGENASGRTFDIAFDDVGVDASFIEASPAATPVAMDTPAGTRSMADAAHTDHPQAAMIRKSFAQRSSRERRRLPAPRTEGGSRDASKHGGFRDGERERAQRRRFLGRRASRGFRNAPLAAESMRSSKVPAPPPG